MSELLITPSAWGTYEWSTMRERERESVCVCVCVCGEGSADGYYTTSPGERRGTDIERAQSERIRRSGVRLARCVGVCVCKRMRAQCVCQRWTEDGCGGLIGSWHNTSRPRPQRSDLDLHTQDMPPLVKNERQERKWSCVCTHTLTHMCERDCP